MQEKRNKVNWSSAIGWIIFILVIAGAPLFNFLRRALSGVVALPANVVPLLIGGLVVLSMIVSVVRSVRQASRGRGAASDTRLPTGPPSDAPMPPRGAPLDPPRMPAAPMPPQTAPAKLNQQPLPGGSPRFEPIITPALLIAGLIGLVLIGGLALFVVGLAFP